MKTKMSDSIACVSFIFLIPKTQLTWMRVPPNKYKPRFQASHTCAERFCQNPRPRSGRELVVSLIIKCTTEPGFYMYKFT